MTPAEPTPVQSPQTIYFTILAPWVMSALALLLLAILEIVMQGHVPADVISLLESLVIGSTITGGATGVTHSIANASIQRTVVSTELQRIKNEGAPNATA